RRWGGAAVGRFWQSCAGFVVTPMAVVRFRSTARGKRMVGCTLGGGRKGRSAGSCSLEVQLRLWLRGRPAEGKTAREPARARGQRGDFPRRVPHAYGVRRGVGSASTAPVPLRGLNKA